MPAIRHSLSAILLAILIALPSHAQDTDTAPAAPPAAADTTPQTGHVTSGADMIRDAEDNPLAAPDLDTPRETMRTYLRAMVDYKKGLDTNDDALKARIDDAVACLDLSSLPLLNRAEMGKEAAILLKEVIDRQIYVNYDKIPDVDTIDSWTLATTQITIVQQENEYGQTVYLFSTRTVKNAASMYQKVKEKTYMEGTSGAGYQEPWLERNLPESMQGETLGFPNWQWIGIFLAILAGLIIKTVTTWLVHGLKSIAGKSKTDWDDLIVVAVEKPAGLLAAGVFWYFAIHFLRFTGSALSVLTIAVQVILSIAVVWGLYRMVDVLTAYLERVTGRTETTLDDQLVPLVRKALRIFIIIFGVLVTIQNLGFNVVSVLAGLGLGGLAFALAARDTCANLFGSIMIILDRPFQVGDWVIVGDVEGSVEEIGFRSTRVRTFYNSLITVPNSIMANANIDNMGAREYRRIKCFFGLTYDTPPEKLEAFIEGVKNIVKANEFTRKDYFHVVFNGYGASSLDIMLYCFLKVPDWSKELVEKQNLFIEIYRLAAELGVDFAFPTQSLHVETFPEKQLIRQPHDIDRQQLEATAAGFLAGGQYAMPTGQGIFTPPYEDDKDPHILRGNDDSGE